MNDPNKIHGLFNLDVNFLNTAYEENWSKEKFIEEWKERSPEIARMSMEEILTFPQITKLFDQ